MTAARKRTFNGPSMSPQSRNGAYAAININWKLISPDGDREERLAWIAEYLSLKSLDSLTDLSDEQLGKVAGEMKRLTGHTNQSSQTRESTPTRSSSSTSGSVVRFPRPYNTNFAAPGDADGEVSHAASHEQVYTLEKLEDYLKWPSEDMAAYLKKRFKCTSFRMLRYKQAHSCTHQLLMIAAHRDLKQRNGGQPVSREAIGKYMPLLKAELNIDQNR